MCVYINIYNIYIYNIYISIYFICICMLTFDLMLQSNKDIVIKAVNKMQLNCY